MPYTKKVLLQVLIVIIAVACFVKGHHVEAADLADAPVYASAVQSDGKIVIGGMFSSYNNTTRNYIARINEDGTLDTTFDPGTGPNNEVNAIAIQDDGRIVIAGSFITYDGVSRNRIARINADGSLDTTFDPGTGVALTGSHFPISNIAIQSDGKIIVVGNFDTYNGITRQSIALINTDGSLDTTFDPGNGAGVAGNVDAVLIQPDGKIIIGGYFEKYYFDTYYQRIIRFNTDGSIDTTFFVDISNDPVQIGDVYDLALQSDGKIIASIHTTEDPEEHMIRLSANGSYDNTFDSGATWVSGTGYYYTVYDIDIQSDGNIFLSGDLEYYKENDVYSIIRVDTDGYIDNSFISGSGVTGGMDGNIVWSTEILSTGQILIAGDFTAYDGTPSNNIALLNGDGSIDTSFGGGGDSEGVQITIEMIDEITDTSATGHANLTAVCEGGEPPSYCYNSFDRYIEWTTDTEAGFNDSCDAGDGGLDEEYSCDITGLTPGTLYYVRAYAEQRGGEGEVVDTFYSEVVTFTTTGGSGPSGNSNSTTLSLTMSENLTINCGSDIDLDSGTVLIPNNPQSTTTTCTVTTNDQSGYLLQLTNDRGSNNTLYHQSQSTNPNGQIQDKTPWNPTTPNAQTWETTGLGFGILNSTATKNETWWGTATDCTDTTQLYAGIPQSPQTIMEHTDYSNTSTATTICYTIDIPATQISGEYEGSVTYTATGRP